MAEWFIEKVMIGRILHCTCDISENENEFLLKRKLYEPYFSLIYFTYLEIIYIYFRT